MSSIIEPDLVKIDRHFISRIDQSIATAPPAAPQMTRPRQT